jgi:hypothetical protein
VLERAGNILELVGIGKDFLRRTQMAQQLRERIYKWDYMKSESFCTTREEISELKSLHAEWEKIFTTEKGLITRIYSKLKKLNSPKINEPMKKWAKKKKNGQSFYKRRNPTG